MGGNNNPKLYETLRKNWFLFNLMSESSQLLFWKGVLQFAFTKSLLFRLLISSRVINVVEQKDTEKRGLGERIIL